MAWLLENAPRCPSCRSLPYCQGGFSTSLRCERFSVSSCRNLIYDCTRSEAYRLSVVISLSMTGRGVNTFRLCSCRSLVWQITLCMHFASQLVASFSLSDQIEYFSARARCVCILLLTLSLLFIYQARCAYMSLPKFWSLVCIVRCGLVWSVVSVWCVAV